MVAYPEEVCREGQITARSGGWDDRDDSRWEGGASTFGLIMNLSRRQLSKSDCLMG